MKKTIKYIIALIALITIFAGCKPKIQYVPIESVKTKYEYRYLRDSIVLYDSVYVREKGDTIWLEKYKFIYRDRYNTDTVRVSDSIGVPYPVKGDPIPYMTSFQSFQMWCGRILLLILIFYFGYKYIRRFI